MKAKGWSIKDIKLTPTKSGFNYTYVLQQGKVVDILNFSKKEVAKKINFDSTKTTISELNNNKAKILIPNLKIGQSGIIVHKYQGNNSIIVSSAFVVNSNSQYSTIELTPFNGLVQKAIPTSKREPKDGDTFILNYLYNSSLLIAPNDEVFRSVRNSYFKHNFLHADIFGAYLKDKSLPRPTKKDIQKYAVSQNIGTIFFVIKNRVYVVDTLTFKIIESTYVKNDSSKEQMPFYTRVEDIKKAPLDFDFNFFGSSDEELPYNEYYKKLLGLTK
jgi:hypothetical protein